MDKTQRVLLKAGRKDLAQEYYVKIATSFPSDDKGRYMLLNRMQQDCKYFIRNPSDKHLWSGNVKDHIKDMKTLYNMLPEKPEWITMKDILKYEKDMKKKMYDGIAGSPRGQKMGMKDLKVAAKAFNKSITGMSKKASVQNVDWVGVYLNS